MNRDAWHSHKGVLCLLLLSIQICLNQSQTLSNECYFIGADEKSFVSVISSSVRPNEVIMSSTVLPSTANITLHSIRSSNFPEIDFRQHIILVKSNSNLSFVLEKPIPFPLYPSAFRETFLYVVIKCNEQLYSLTTIRVKNSNQFAPQFYGQIPYTIDISKETIVSSIINTPILAIDWDPNPSYSVTYEIVRGGEWFALNQEHKWSVHDLKQFSLNGVEEWSFYQRPSMLRLVVMKELDLENESIAIDLVAKDNGKPLLVNFTTLYIRLVDTHKLSANMEPFYSIKDSKGASSNDDHTDSSIRFHPCFYNVKANAAAEKGTTITKLITVGNKSNNNIEFELINGNKLFAIDSKTGLISLKSDLPQRKQNGIYFSATIKINGTRPKKDPQFCRIATIRVSVMNETIHSQLYESDGQEFIRAKSQQAVTAADITDKRLENFFFGETSHVDQQGIHHHQLDENKNFNELATVAIAQLNISAMHVKPRFDTDRYEFSLPENIEPQPFASVSIYHWSPTKTPNIEYEILPNNDAKYFQINKRTGQISSVVAFDYEERKFYGFQVRACLPNTESECQMTNVTVSIINTNDNAPKFDKLLYSVDLPMDTTVGTEIIRLSAHDDESGTNSKITYTIKIPSDKFMLDHETGAITTAAIFTEEREYNLIVEANDQGLPSLQGVATVSVAVHGSNPSPPEFDQFSYDATILSPVPAGSVLITVHANDPDPGSQGRIAYRFAETNDSQTLSMLRNFTINPNTGQLSTKFRLAPENNALLHFIVEASDQSLTQPRMANAVVQINLISRKNQSIAFLPLPKKIFIPISKLPGSLLLRAPVTRTIEPPRYTWRESNGTNYFEMTNDQLKVKSKLSEGIYEMVLRVEAGEAFAEHTLDIVVMLDREKYPIFPQLTYDVEVPVNATFPLVITDFKASVQRGAIMYSAQPSKLHISGLRVDNHTGELNFDQNFIELYRNKPAVFMVIRATNVRYPQYFSDVVVSIKVSNGFAFPVRLYRLQMLENLPIGTTLNTTLRVNNLPPFGQVKYTVKPENLFSIDRNGVMKSLNKIDAEQLSPNSNGIINLIVTADNGNEKSSTKVQVKVIDENEFPPEFDQKNYEFTIHENSGAGIFVGKLTATDRDYSKSRLRFSLEGNDTSLFEIHDDGTIFVSENASFDREMTSNYSYTVIVNDGNGRTDATNMTVQILDINDNSPKILEPLTWNVVEGSEGIGAKFIVRAEDADIGENGAVSYNIIRGNEGNSLKIEPLDNNKAQITVAKALDRETEPRHSLTIEARDHGIPQLLESATLLLNVQDINDNRPIFTQNTYKQTIPIGAPPGFPIFNVAATDKDSDSQLIYRIKSDPSDLFSINSVTGAVEITGQIYKRKQGIYNIVIEVSDGKFSSEMTAEITLYDSDAGNSKITLTPNRPPKFSRSSYEFTVDEGTKGRIGTVNCADPDNDEITLRIEPKTLKHLFMVENFTLLAMKPLRYSAYTTPYSFLLIATDHGTPRLSAIANVRVNVNENKDQLLEFEYSSYSVDIPHEDLLPIKLPLNIRLKGNDNSDVHRNIRYSLDGQDSECFVMDTQTPTVKFICNANFHSKSKYLLKVVATDENARFSAADIEVLVSAPIAQTEPFTSINSMTKPPVYKPPRNKCDLIIQQENIELTLIHNVIKAGAFYKLPVNCNCTDGCDIVYKFVNQQFQAYFELNPNGTLVAKREISIDDLQTDGLIDKSGNVITDIILISNKKQRKIRILLKMNEETLETIETINVGVKFPVLNNRSANRAPSFPHDEYHASLPEGRYDSGSVLSMKPMSVKAVDLDEDANGLLTYSILSNMPNLPFSVKNTSGKLVVFGRVDRENYKEYEFKILATDGGNPPLSASAKVFVMISDVNDNYPSFIDPPLAIPCDVNARAGSVVAKFFAVDADEGRNAEISYSLANNTEIFEIDEKIMFSLRVEIFDETDVPQFKNDVYMGIVTKQASPRTKIAQVVAGIVPMNYTLSDSYSGLFEISNDGMISLGRLPTSSEKNQHYFLNVTAVNELNDHSMTQVNIFVEETPSVNQTVTESNTNYCKFDSKIFNARIRENTPGRHHLLKVSSNCERENHPYKYLIFQGLDQFEVDPKSGAVSVYGALDREKKSLHFIILNVTKSFGSMPGKRQINPIIEYSKSKLDSWQTLVTVHVLDENDNAPEFLKRNSENVFVFTVDWQANVLTSIARFEAKDRDESSSLQYWMASDDQSSSNYFSVNRTSGVLTLVRSLNAEYRDIFEFTVIVSDGLHNVTSPVKIYKLSLQKNLVLLSADIQHQQVEDWKVERMMSESTENDIRILVKQPYTNDKGQADPYRTHFLVYSLREGTKEPFPGNELESILKENRDVLAKHLLNLSIMLPLVSPTARISLTELILLIICAILLLMAFVMLACIVFYCKRARRGEDDGSNYMFDSHTAGPKPYDVGIFDRKTAQSILSSRALPNPYETSGKYDIYFRSSPPLDCILTPGTGSLDSSSTIAKSMRVSEAYRTSGPRSRNFSGDVGQIHEIIRSQSEKDDALTVSNSESEEALFPVYRASGYN